MNRTTAAGANVVLFWFATAALGLVVIGLWQNHYTGDLALRYWAKLLAVLDSTGIRLENLGALYPHGRFYALAPFHYLGPLDSPGAPYLVSALVAAGLIVLWNHHLRRAGHPASFRAVLIGLALVHPALLWNATNGALGTISLLFFYLLYMAALRMVQHRDIHSFIMLGVVLALFFFVDEVTFYLFVALVPLLALMVPRQILVSAPLSAYVILATPLMVVILGWLYFNWVFYGTPLAFLSEPHSGFLGARQDVEHIRWLRTYGGEWVAPGAVAAVLTAAAYPVLFLLLGRAARHPAHFSAAIVLLLHPVVAVALATYDYFLSHPMEIVALVVAGVMAELTMLDSRRPHVRWAAIGLLSAGVVGGWYGFLHDATPAMQRWASALVAPVSAGPHSGDAALGRWLNRNRGVTLMDEGTAYRVIAARGDAEGLVLPFSDSFKIELRRGRPGLDMVVVPDPGTARGRRDAINQRWPELYKAGIPGYSLVYDDDGWRVWRRSA